MKQPLEVETISEFFKKQPSIIINKDIMEPNSKTTLRSPELLKMLINRARPEISEIEEIYLTTKGSISFFSIENFIQLNRHKAMPMDPTINNGSDNILLLRVKII